MTDPGRRPSWPRRLLAKTIWARGTFGIPPDRHASLYRVVLPLYAASLLMAGTFGVIYGAPAFVDFSDGLRNFGLGWGVWTTAAAGMSLVGLAFPKLLPVEAIGQSGLVASCVVYLAVLIILTGGGSTTRYVAVGVSTAALLVSSWRVGDLRVERQIRELERQREARR